MKTASSAYKVFWDGKEKTMDHSWIIIYPGCDWGGEKDKKLMVNDEGRCKMINLNEFYFSVNCFWSYEVFQKKEEGGGGKQ